MENYTKMNMKNKIVFNTIFFYGNDLELLEVYDIINLVIE